MGSHIVLIDNGDEEFPFYEFNFKKSESMKNMVKSMLFENDITDEDDVEIIIQINRK